MQETSECESARVPESVGRRRQISGKCAGLQVQLIWLRNRWGRDGTVSSVFIGFGDGSAKQLDDAVEKALAQK